MGKKLRDAEAVAEMREIAATLALHGDEVPQLATARTSLDNVLAQIDALSTQRTFHQFNKQNASQQLRTRIEEGSKNTTVVRFTLKQHFGSRSEDLVKFGLQPSTSTPFALPKRRTISSKGFPWPRPSTSSR